MIDGKVKIPVAGIGRPRSARPHCDVWPRTRRPMAADTSGARRRRAPDSWSNRMIRTGDTTSSFHQAPKGRGYERVAVDAESLRDYLKGLFSLR